MTGRRPRGPSAAPPDESDLKFADALDALLRDEDDFLKSSGQPNYHGFARRLGVHSETLRKAVSGERPVTPRLMEDCARVLRRPPSYFAEWRLWDAQRRYDPREVGWETALANLAAHAADGQRARPRRRR